MTEPAMPPEGAVYYLFPEWFGGKRVPEALSPELQARFARWNQVWENDLNPIAEIRWPTAQMGWEWIAEGDELVRLIQADLGDGVKVIERFHIYAPEP